MRRHHRGIFKSTIIGAYNIGTLDQVLWPWFRIPCDFFLQHKVCTRACRIRGILYEYNTGFSALLKKHGMPTYCSKRSLSLSLYWSSSPLDAMTRYTPEKQNEFIWYELLVTIFIDKTPWFFIFCPSDNKVLKHRTEHKGYNHAEKTCNMLATIFFLFVQIKLLRIKGLCKTNRHIDRQTDL